MTRIREPRAVELMTTGMCPLKCEYCYIPKTDEMVRMHEQIVEDLKSGEYFDRLEKIVGDRIEYLGFWGTEPTLTLPIIKEKIPEIFRRFSKIKEISFSTSMIGHAGEIVVDFIKELADYPVKVKVQMSLDGPAWITDKNRMEGASEFIPANFRKAVTLLNDVELGKCRVEFSWKATHGIENMQGFIDVPARVVGYDEFFRSHNDWFYAENKNEKVFLNHGSYVPTLVVPGKYTSSDGKIFSEYLSLLDSMNVRTTYPGRLHRLFRYEDELSKRCMFSCSGGDSNFGLGREVHICHRTFYLNDDRYIDSVLKDKEIENWDVSLFKRGTIEHIRKNFIVPVDDTTRFFYTMRGYHDFWKFQNGYIVAMVKEMALSGQASPEYLTDDQLCLTLALFLGGAMSCPMENVLNTGSIHLQLMSIIRLWANGAFQQVLGRVVEDYNVKLSRRK